MKKLRQIAEEYKDKLEKLKEMRSQSLSVANKECANVTLYATAGELKFNIMKHVQEIVEIDPYYTKKIVFGRNPKITVHLNDDGVVTNVEKHWDPMTDKELEEAKKVAGQFLETTDYKYTDLERHMSSWNARMEVELKSKQDEIDRLNKIVYSYANTIIKYSDMKEKIITLITKIDVVRPDIQKFIEEVETQYDHRYYGESFSQELQEMKDFLENGIREST